MPNWSKQSKLVRNTDSVSNTISVLLVWAKEMSDKKLKSFMESAFRTLNNPNRYKYFWQMDTVTFEKYVVFLVCLKELCRRGRDGDWYYHIVNDLKIDTSKSWITLYYILKLYRLKYDDLCEIDLAVDNDSIESLLRNSNTTGYEFKDTNYYDYLDIVKKCLKKIKKGKLGGYNDIECGNITTDLYNRRSIVETDSDGEKPVVSSKGKKKKKQKVSNNFPSSSW